MQIMSSCEHYALGRACSSLHADTAGKCFCGFDWLLWLIDRRGGKFLSETETPGGDS